MGIFLGVSILAVLAGLGVILFKHPVYSVLSLVLCMALLGIVYGLCAATFLAVVHLIVYAGAIMVLFLYVIMLINLQQQDTEGYGRTMRVLAWVSGVGLVGAIGVFAMVLPIAHVTVSVGTVQRLGQLLFEDYLVPFEATSILFLATVVGVVLLTKESRP